MKHASPEDLTNVHYLRAQARLLNDKLENSPQAHAQRVQTALLLAMKERCPHLLVDTLII